VKNLIGVPEEQVVVALQGWGTAVAALHSGLLLRAPDIDYSGFQVNFVPRAGENGYMAQKTIVAGVARRKSTGY
jgi:hypothetical protein